MGSFDGTKRNLLDTQFQSALALKEAGDLQEAKSVLTRLIDDYKRGGWFGRAAMAGINLGQIYQREGALDEAASCFSLALKQSEKAEDTRRSAICVSGLATIAQDRGHTDEAEDLLNRAYVLFESINDPVGMGNQQGNLGVLRQGQGRFTEALSCFYLAAEFFSSAGFSGGLLGVLQCLAETHRRQGELNEAEVAFNRVMLLARKTKAPLAEAVSLRGLGQLARTKGDLNQAMQYIQKGLEMHRAHHDLKGELSTLVDLAAVCFSSGSTQQALAHLDKCIERSEEAGFQAPLTRALLNRALYRLDTTHVDKVQNDLAAFRALMPIGCDPIMDSAYTILSTRLNLRSGYWEEAKKALDRELHTTETSLSLQTRPVILGLLGTIDLLQGRLERAAHRFIESEKHYRALGDREGAAFALMGATQIKIESGAFEQSRNILRQLQESYLTQGSPQPAIEAEITFMGATISYFDGQFEAAETEALAASSKFHNIGFERGELKSKLLQFSARTRLENNRNGYPDQANLDRLNQLRTSISSFGCPTLEILAEAEYGLACGRRGAQYKGQIENIEKALKTAQTLHYPEGEALALLALARLQSNKDRAIEAYRILDQHNKTSYARLVAREWEI